MARARVVTDVHASYKNTILQNRPHKAVLQTKAEQRNNDAVQTCGWTISQFKQSLLGTRAGAVGP